MKQLRHYLLKFHLDIKKCSRKSCFNDYCFFNKSRKRVELIIYLFIVIKQNIKVFFCSYLNMVNRVRINRSWTEDVFIFLITQYFVEG